MKAFAEIVNGKLLVNGVELLARYDLAYHPDSQHETLQRMCEMLNTELEKWFMSQPIEQPTVGEVVANMSCDGNISCAAVSAEVE